MQIYLSLIPQIIKEYEAIKFVDDNGCVYLEVTGAMYGLAQSGCIANQDLQKHFAKYGYYPTKRTPGTPYMNWASRQQKQHKQHSYNSSIKLQAT